MVHQLQFTNRYWYIITKETPYFRQISLILTYCPPSVPGFQPRYHITSNSHVSPSSFLVAVSQTPPTPPFLWPWQFTGLEFVCFSHYKIRAIGFWRKFSEVKYQPHQILSVVHTVNMICDCWYCPGLSRRGSVCLASLFPCWPCRKPVTLHSPCWRNEYCAPPPSGWSIYTIY